MGKSELAELAGLVLPQVWQRPPAFQRGESVGGSTLVHFSEHPHSRH